MTTPISDSPALDRNTVWNLLPVLGTSSWPCVVLVNGMMSYLVGGSQEQLNYLAGQTVTLPVDEQNRQRTYVLSGPAACRLRSRPT